MDLFAQPGSICEMKTIRGEERVDTNLIIASTVFAFAATTEPFMPPSDFPFFFLWRRSKVCAWWRYSWGRKAQWHWRRGTRKR
jgi:hypothetical protein